MIQVGKPRPRAEQPLLKVRRPEFQSITPPWTLKYRSAYLCFRETWCTFEGAKLTLPIPKDPRQQTNLQWTPRSLTMPGVKRGWEGEQRHLQLRNIWKRCVLWVIGQEPLLNSSSPFPKLFTPTVYAAFESMQSKKLYIILIGYSYFLKNLLTPVYVLHLVILYYWSPTVCHIHHAVWVKTRSGHFQHLKIKYVPECASIFKNSWISTLSSNKWRVGIFPAPKPFKMSRSAKCNIRTGLGTKVWLLHISTLLTTIACVWNSCTFPKNCQEKILT